MPRTKTRPKAKPDAPASPNGSTDDVLTLAEAAAYLRLPEQEVIGAASSQGLPARLVGEEWRFLKAALQQWLSVSQPTAEMRKAAQLAFAGSWKDDPFFEDIKEAFEKNRGRPMFEDE